MNQEKANAKRICNMPEFILVLVVASTISLFTLWLIESWIKYILYLLEVALIVIIWLILGNYNIRVGSKKIVIKRMNSALVPDLLLIAGSLALIFFEYYGIEESIVQLVVAMILTAFLSGHALLNIFGLNKHFSKLELLVFSYVVGFSFSAILLYGGLPFASTVRNTVMCIVFLFLGVFSAFKHVASPSKASRKSLTRSVDLLPILLAVVFYTISWVSMYPQFAVLSGTDISRHFSGSIVLSRTPDLHIETAYLLHHSYQSAFISLSNGSLVPVQTMLVFLNVMLPLAFYVMAKEYLEKVDRRLPVLSTVFWTFFSGFAWTYVAKLKMTTPSLTELQYLITAADATYRGTIYLAQPFLWFIPFSVSLMLLFVSLYFLRRIDLPKTTYMSLFSLLIAVSYLTHVTEATFFALFLSIYTAFSRNKELRMDDALISTIVGFVSAALVLCVVSFSSFRFFQSPSNLLSLALPVVACSAALLVRRFGVNRVIPNLSITRAPILRSLLVVSLLSAYIVAFPAWALPGARFGMWQVDEIGIVPWFMYPVILGVSGILAILSLFCLTEQRKKFAPLSIFVALFFLSPAFGRAISIVNANFFVSGYWERRFLPFVFLAACMLAPIPLLEILRRLRSNSMVKKGAAMMLVSLVVFCGMQSSFYVVEYHSICTGLGDQPTESEFEALEYMRDVFESDPRAWVVTVTRRSYDTVVFSAPADRLVNSQVLYTSGTPELCLSVLFRASYLGHPYLYLHQVDLDFLKNYSGGWLVSHLVPTLPLVFSNNEVKIYNISRVFPAVMDSDTVLVVPFNEASESNPGYLYVYDMLSQAFINYSVAYDLDPLIWQAKTLILGFDPPLDVDYSSAAQTVRMYDYWKYVESGGNITVFNTNGYGVVSEQLFTVSDSKVETYTIQGASANLSLPLPLRVNKLTPILPNVNMVASYVSQNDSIPYVLEVEIGRGTLTYVNIYPVIATMLTGEASHRIYDSMTALLEIINLDVAMLDPDFRQVWLHTFKEVHMNGNIALKARSILFHPNSEIDKVTATLNNETAMFTNATTILLANYSHATITAASATITDGRGFYARVAVNGMASITFTGDATLAIHSDQGDTKLNRVSGILFDTGEFVDLIIRTPEVTVQGNTYFKELHLRGDLGWKLRTYGQDLKVNGSTSFDIGISDSYTVLRSMTIRGSYSRNPSLIRFDERATLKTAAFWGIIALPVFLVFFLVIQRKKKMHACMQSVRRSNLAMTDPYYLTMEDPQEFLRHYLSLYEEDYKKARARKIVSLFPELRDKKVLDIGCGGGYYSLAARRKKCKSVTLVDISLVSVKGAKLALLENGSLDSEGLVAEATNLPLKNQCFHFVLCIDLIEHVQKDDALLCEIRRVLRDNGFMLVATQNSNSMNYILEAFMQRYVLKNRGWMGWDTTHLRFHTPKRLLHLLRNYGFAPIEIGGTYFIPYLLATWLNRINRRFSRALYHILMLINDRLELKHKALWNLFGWGFICLCVKSTRVRA